MTYIPRPLINSYIKIFFKYSFVVILLMICSCSPTEPDHAGFEAAAAVANDVNTSALLPLINQLALVHNNDTPVNSDGYDTEELFPARNLTRDAAFKLISETFVSMGYTPDTIKLGDGPQAAYNISAEWKGTTHPDQVILLASHLDAFYQGADDNGSAVAAMLEIARAVRKHKFSRTIRFVAFDLEEFGSVGSTRYVKAGYADDVVTAIVMDMIGYASNKPHSQDDLFALKLPDTADFLLAIGNENSSAQTQQLLALSSSYGLAKLTGVLAPGDGTYLLSSILFMRSDHGLLWFNHVPTIFLTDTANLRNPNYHKPTDTPETLDYDFLKKNTKAIAAAVALFAGVR